MTEHQRETEVKFCVRSLHAPVFAPVSRNMAAEAGRWSLIQPRTFEVNLRFDTSHGDLRRAGRVLRLRKDERARLTYKDQSRELGGAVGRREIEFVVDDFDSARQLIEALGFEVVFIYEKYRSIFEHQGTCVMLDELPYGKFIEIEGELGTLRPVAEWLRLDWAKAIPASYHSLFERLRKSRGLTFRDLTFDNFRTVRVSPQDMSVDYADTPDLGRESR